MGPNMGVCVGGGDARQDSTLSSTVLDKKSKFEEEREGNIPNITTNN
jgi:hypothetical protein